MWLATLKDVAWFMHVMIGGAAEKKEAGDSPPAGLSRGKSLKERMAMFGN